MFFLNNLLWKFSGFVHYVEDYCCAKVRNQQSFLTSGFLQITGKKGKNGLRLGADIFSYRMGAAGP